MTKIASVEAVTVVVPLQTGVAFSTRSVAERNYGLVRITTDDGVTGIGFCYAGHRAGDLVTDAVIELLAPVLIGEDPCLVEWLWQRMYDESLLHGRAGAVMRALSALDIALWDRNARAVSLPLWRYLGGYAKDSVAAYASGGYSRTARLPVTSRLQHSRTWPMDFKR
jgi:L-alanine-DL-glutamate epimerase-like enolase superfamily enzyme